MLGAGQRTPT